MNTLAITKVINNKIVLIQINLSTEALHTLTELYYETNRL
jgi:hypothetical protein